MDALLEQIITDFHSRDLPSFTPRQTLLPNIKGKINTIIGMRRAGKTFFLYQLIQTYLIQGIPKHRILYINFDDERLVNLSAQNLHQVLDVYYRCYPQNKQETCYIFFDEIQNITGWEKFIRRLLDTEKVKIVLTGSSSKLLSREIATSLRGRAITTEIFPFSFYEAIINQEGKFDISLPLSSEKRAFLENRFRGYLQKGGFPEVQSLSEDYRMQILQEYVDVVLFRDIIERYTVNNVQPLRQLILQLLSAPATLFSINKFYNDLKSRGIACSKDTLHDYLDYLTDTFLIYPVTLYTRSERIRRVNPRKIYVIDNGLANAFLNQPHSDQGRLLENFVYMELRRHCRASDSIYYYRTLEGYELDFIVSSLRAEKKLIQVTLDLNDPNTRDREIRALKAGMQECKLKSGILITLEHKEIIEVEEGTIYVIPASEWMLSSI